MSKVLMCPCEDVTIDEVDHAIDKGFCDVESIKRYTGFGTGICQGKQCLAPISALIAQKSRPPLHDRQVLPFTPRPPLFPTEFNLWASLHVKEGDFQSEGTPPRLEETFGEDVLRSSTPIRSKAKIVIIGGGIMGLALAHNLALQGEKDVVVLEKGYLCAGASGRNGGGVRMQWGTPINIELAKRSIHLMKHFAKEMGINVWLRQGGYLFLAKTPAVANRLEKSIALHNSHGVHTKLLTADACREVVPQLNMKGVLSAAYNKDDGVIFPWPFMWGYAQSCAKQGIAVETFTNVTGFAVSNERITQVHTDRGSISCDQVVLAAGAWSPQIAKMAGVTLPNEPHRHEICSSEPLKPFLGPLVSVLDTGLYFSQSMRGEIVGGMGDPHEPAGMQLGSSARFLSRYSQAMTELLPNVGQVKILRQWAGPYDVTPDNSPILGATPGVSNLLQMSGFVGHGFMMAPAVAERMAKWMATGESDELFTRYTLGRFAEGRLENEREEMIIG